MLTDQQAWPKHVVAQLYLAVPTPELIFCTNDPLPQCAHRAVERSPRRGMRSTQAVGENIGTKQCSEQGTFRARQLSGRFPENPQRVSHRCCTVTWR